MSDDEDEQLPSLLEVINKAKDLLKNLKDKVIAAGDNTALAASSILSKDGERDQLINTLNRLSHRAEQEAVVIWNDIIFFVDNHDIIENYFWGRLNNKLKDLGKADLDFRRKCLFRKIEFIDDHPDSTLFHHVCTMNPPAYVIQTLIDITPPAFKNDEDTWLKYPLSSPPYPIGKEFNHLARIRGEYPLHMIMRHGGSLDVVKLLSLGANKREGALFDVSSSCDSVFHVLTANKAIHEPRAFTDILRFLVLSLDVRIDWSALLEVRSSEKLPLTLLCQSLMDEGLSDLDILRDANFVFLVKATCYYHSRRTHYYSSEEEERSKSYDGRLKQIENVEFAYAFLVCCCWFDRQFMAKALKHLFTLDKSFLLEKDMHGIYPLLGIVKGSYLISNHSCAGFEEFIVETILGIAPQCAQQEDEKGLLPLHIVADLGRRFIVRDGKRLSLVSTIWKAYPEAISKIDEESGLPPFALPVRGLSEGHDHWYRNGYQNDNLCLSSSYFLLRQRPDVLSEVIEIAKAEETTEPPAKRTCTRLRTKKAT